MEEKYEIQKTISGIINASDSLTFKNQYMIDSLTLEVAKITQTVTMELIENIQKPLDQLNDTIMNVRTTIGFNSELQKIFMVGELNALSKMVLEMSKLLEESVITLGDKKNGFLRSVITEIGNNTVMTHSELAKKMNLKPAALTMRMKRDNSWRKYVSAYTHPSKGNSVIYILNKSGHQMFDYFDEKEVICNYEKDSNGRSYIYSMYYIDGSNELGGFKNGEYRKINPISEFGEFEFER